MPMASVRAYTVYTTLAEKLEAVVVLGGANSRTKDYYDLSALPAALALDGSILAESIRRTFARRATAVPAVPLEGLSDDFARAPLQASRWRAFLDKGGLRTSEIDFVGVVEAIRAFAEPVLDGGDPGALGGEAAEVRRASLGISSHSGITSPDYVVYSPRHMENGRFLHHFLRNKILTNVYLTMSNGIRPSQWRLEPERFADFSVFIPPREEQEQIAAFLDGETARIDTLVAKVRDAIDRLKELRSALISAAVTGKIDVREEACG
jgi:hypothetical protein